MTTPFIAGKRGEHAFMVLLYKLGIPFEDVRDRIEYKLIDTDYVIRIHDNEIRFEVKTIRSLTVDFVDIELYKDRTKDKYGYPWRSKAHFFVIVYPDDDYKMLLIKRCDEFLATLHTIYNNRAFERILKYDNNKRIVMRIKTYLIKQFCCVIQPYI